MLLLLGECSNRKMGQYLAKYCGKVSSLVSFFSVNSLGTGCLVCGVYRGIPEKGYGVGHTDSCLFRILLV